MRSNLVRRYSGVLKKIGKQCKEFRHSLGITQREVANSLGITASAVSYFETGKIDSVTIFAYYIRNGFFDWVSYTEIMGALV